MESFGARMKREREQRKISLDDISIATKIATRFLVALEGDHFDQLPGGVFNKGFVRSYARHLGLDENQTVADFVAASGASPPESEPLDAPALAAIAHRTAQTTTRRKNDGEGIPWEFVAAGLLVVAFGFAFWGFHTREKPPRANRSVVAGQAAASREAPSDAAVKPSSAETLSPETLSPQPAAADSSAHGAEIATPATPGDSAKAPSFVVLIRAHEEAWVAITVDGKQPVQDTLTASAERSIEAQNQVIVKTGNVGALDISFNGKKLAPQGGYNQVKTLTFDPNGLRP